MFGPRPPSLNKPIYGLGVVGSNPKAAAAKQVFENNIYKRGFTSHYPRKFTISTSPWLVDIVRSKRKAQQARTLENIRGQHKQPPQHKPSKDPYNRVNEHGKEVFNVMHGFTV